MADFNLVLTDTITAALPQEVATINNENGRYFSADVTISNLRIVVPNGSGGFGSIGWDYLEPWITTIEIVPLIDISGVQPNIVGSFIEKSKCYNLIPNVGYYNGSDAYVIDYNIAIPQNMHFMVELLPYTYTISIFIYNPPSLQPNVISGNITVKLYELHYDTYIMRQEYKELTFDSAGLNVEDYTKLDVFNVSALDDSLPVIKMYANTNISGSETVRYYAGTYRLNTRMRDIVTQWDFRPYPACFGIPINGNYKYLFEMQDSYSNFHMRFIGRKYMQEWKV